VVYEKEKDEEAQLDRSCKK